MRQQHILCKNPFGGPYSQRHRRRSMGFIVRRVLLIYCVGRDGIGLSNRLDERVKESQPFYLYSIIYYRVYTYIVYIICV